MPSPELKLPIAPGLLWASIPLLEHQPPRPLKALPQGLAPFPAEEKLPFLRFLLPFNFFVSF